MSTSEFLTQSYMYCYIITTHEMYMANSGVETGVTIVLPDTPASMATDVACICEITYMLHAVY